MLRNCFQLPLTETGHQKLTFLCSKTFIICSGSSDVEFVEEGSLWVRRENNILSLHCAFVVHPFDTFDQISPTIEIYFLTHDMYQLQFYIKTPICKFLFKINYESQLRKFFTTCIKMNSIFDTKVCYPP